MFCECCNLYLRARFCLLESQNYKISSVERDPQGCLSPAFWGALWRINWLAFPISNTSENLISLFPAEIEHLLGLLRQRQREFCKPCARFSRPTKCIKLRKKNSHNDLTTNFTTGTTSIGILYQLQWLLMKENYSKKKNQT